MKIKCFGIAKDITQTDTINFSGSEAPLTVDSLKSWLAQQYPEFNNIKNCMIAVNQEYADDSTRLSSDDEIAIIPPVSGG